MNRSIKAELSRINSQASSAYLLSRSSTQISSSCAEQTIGISKRDFSALAMQIKAMRDRFGFTPSDEFIYDICKRLLGVNGDQAEKRFKMNNIMREMPDEFIRKMRLTGLILPTCLFWLTTTRSRYPSPGVEGTTETRP